MEVSDNNTNSERALKYNDDFTLVKPKKKDRVKLIGGNFSGRIGLLIGIDENDGIVKMDDGGIRIIPMNYCAKIDNEKAGDVCAAEKNRKKRERKKRRAALVKKLWEDKILLLRHSVMGTLSRHFFHNLSDKAVDLMRSNPDVWPTPTGKMLSKEGEVMEYTFMSYEEVMAPITEAERAQHYKAIAEGWPGWEHCKKLWEHKILLIIHKHTGQIERRPFSRVPITALAYMRAHPEEWPSPTGTLRIYKGKPSFVFVPYKEFLASTSVPMDSTTRFTLGSSSSSVAIKRWKWAIRRVIKLEAHHKQETAKNKEEESERRRRIREARNEEKAREDKEVEGAHAAWHPTGKRQVGGGAAHGERPGGRCGQEGHRSQRAQG